MTDLRDPEPLTATRAHGELAPPRQGLVSRALAPIRRARGQEVVQPQPIALRETAVELRPKRSFNVIRWSLFFVVLLPTLAAAIYLFAFASDQYVAEARFMVSQADPLIGADLGDNGKKDGGSGSPSAATPSPTSALSGSLNIGGEDAEIVASYIHSRAIVDDISRQLDLRAIFQRPEADFWARLPNDASAEKLAKYWNSMVSVNLETTSGIVTVTVSAFRREDALTLGRAIIKSSERLVNDMSSKVRMDLMSTAEEAVRRAEGEVRFALANLTSFRNTRQVIDPVKSAEDNGKLLLDLMSAKIEAESQLFVAERVQGPKAPGMASLRDKLQSVNDHIKELKDQMAGAKALSTNMAATLAQFETLELKKEFAETMYKFASNGVERARISSERQQVYLQVFEPPALPQDFTYPRRWSSLVMVGFISMMIWICGATITASIIDHRL